MSSILAAVQKDLVKGGSQSRDLTGLVKQVKDILPQHSDDVVCEALIQTDEDVMRAVDLLLSPAFMSKASKKKKERRERQADVAGHPPNEAGDRQEGLPAPSGAQAARGINGSSPGDADAYRWSDGPNAGGKELLADTLDEEKEDRPKTALEKQAAKLRKKLREIERIEERLRKGEKVDPLQLPKIEKKSEVKSELWHAEQKVIEEDRQREEDRRQKEAEEERRLREELAAREEALRLERERQEQEALRAAQEAREAALREAEAARYQQPPPTSAPRPQVSPQPLQPQQPQQAMGMELLSMLHKGQADPRHGYQQSEQMAAELSGGRGPVLRGHGGGAPPKVAGYQQQQHWYNQEQPYQQQHQQQGWAHEPAFPPQRYQNGPEDDGDDDGWEEPIAATGGVGQGKDFSGKPDEFANQYSTPLDISRIPAAKRAEAERIANEIEGGVKAGAGGYERHEQGRRNGNFHGQGKYSGGKGGGRAKGDGKGKGKGKSKVRFD